MRFFWKDRFWPFCVRRGSALCALWLNSMTGPGESCLSNSISSDSVFTVVAELLQLGYLRIASQFGSVFGLRYKASLMACPVVRDVLSTRGLGLSGGLSVVASLLTPQFGEVRLSLSTLHQRLVQCFLGCHGPIVSIQPIQDALALQPFLDRRWLYTAR